MRSHMQDVRKIAVVKPSALGDFIFTLPALTALRETFPEAEIVYLGKKWHEEFLAQRDSPIDRVVIVPAVAGVGEVASYRPDTVFLSTFFTKMQEEKFDLAIQLHGGGKYSNPFTKQLGARMTIGTRTPEAEELDKTISYEYYQNEYLRWLEVVGLVGARTTSIMPHFRATAKDIAEVEQVLGQDKQPFVVLHPGATDHKRRWPAERFAAVGDHFSEKGYRIFVTGSGDEEEAVMHVIKGMRRPGESLYNKLSLNALTGLLSLTDLLVSNDTGPLHLTTALGQKTIGIYWCGNIINAAPPFRTDHVSLSSWTVICPLCGENCASGYPFEHTLSTCQHTTSFVTGVSVTDVIQAGDVLLGEAAAVV